jgi:uncharacterized metal-binding protein
MGEYTPDFSLDVQAVKGLCPVGEKYAREQMTARTTPVLTCEGPCIRGEIARLAGNIVAKEVPTLARACHGETFFVPHSAMASWVKGADKVVMIDGCFLKCHGRVLRNLVAEEKIVQIDALPLYKRYTDLFDMDDVPEEERKEVARQVADKIIASLKDADGAAGGNGRRRPRFCASPDRCQVVSTATSADRRFDSSSPRRDLQ